MIQNSELEKNIIISIKGSSYTKSEILSLIEATNNKNIKIQYDDQYVPDLEVDKTLSAFDYCLFLYSKASQSWFLQRCKEFSVPVICTKVGGLEEYLKYGYIGHSVEPRYECIKTIIMQISNNYPYPYPYNGNAEESQPLLDYLKVKYFNDIH